MEEEFLFGDSSIFAIQGAIFHDISKPGLKFGRICFVCNGELIGDYETTVVLYTIANGLQKKLKDHDVNLARQLFSMECHDLIDHVEQLFNKCETAEESARIDSLYLAPGPGEAFDGEIVIWLENAFFDRLVWRKFMSTDIKELFVQVGTVEHTIKLFIDSILTQPREH
jgi:hypothetical protein